MADVQDQIKEDVIKRKEKIWEVIYEIKQTIKEMEKAKYVVKISNKYNHNIVIKNPEGDYYYAREIDNNISKKLLNMMKEDKLPLISKELEKRIKNILDNYPLVYKMETRHNIIDNGYYICRVTGIKIYFYLDTYDSKSDEDLHVLVEDERIIEVSLGIVDYKIFGIFRDTDFAEYEFYTTYNNLEEVLNAIKNSN